MLQTFQSSISRKFLYALHINFLREPIYCERLHANGANLYVYVGVCVCVLWDHDAKIFRASIITFFLTPWQLCWLLLIWMCLHIASTSFALFSLSLAHSLIIQILHSAKESFIISEAFTGARVKCYDGGCTSAYLPRWCEICTGAFVFQFCW